jgi:hypothetical protein
MRRRLERDAGIDNLSMTTRAFDSQSSPPYARHKLARVSVLTCCRKRQPLNYLFCEAFILGMGGSVVKKEIVLLDILTVVALGVRQAEKPFLQDRVGLVPQGQGKT